MSLDFKKRIIEIWDFVKRNGLWIALGFAAFLALDSANAALETVLLLALIESVALGLSGFAAYIYTKANFIKMQMWNTLGTIFLGVHICIGLAVLGVYFTQY